MSGNLTLYRTAERPDLQLWLLDDDGALIDFSAGYTFSWKIGTPGSTAAFTKTTGIVGATGSGVEPSGTPNVTLTFTAGELDAVTRGGYRWQLTATTSGLDRVFQGRIDITDVIT